MNAPATAYRSIRASEITIPEDRIRGVVSPRVDLLKEDIRQQGLLQPLLVVETEGGYDLIDGLQRLTALRRLKRAMVEAHVLPITITPAQRRYAELMSHVNRESLTKLERAETLHALKVAAQEINPGARRGGDRRSASFQTANLNATEGENQSAILALWSEDTAEQVGLSRRAFFRATRIVEQLQSDIRDKLRSTWVADHQSTLAKLADVEDKVRQSALIDKMVSDPPEASSFEAAVALVEGSRPQTDADKAFKGAMASWSRMPKAEKRIFLRSHKAAVLEIIREEGWLGDL